MSMLQAPALTDADFKNPSTELRRRAKSELEKLGITPAIYAEAMELAVYDGSTAILQNLLLVGQGQEALNKAFDIAISDQNRFRFPNDKWNTSAEMLLKAGAHANELTPEHLTSCRNRELDAIVRSSPQFKTDNSLISACLSGDIAAAKKAIAAGADVEQSFDRKKIPVFLLPILRDDADMLVIMAKELQTRIAKKEPKATAEEINAALLRHAAMFHAQNCVVALLNSGVPPVELSKILKSCVERRPGVVSRYHHQPECCIRLLIEAGACTDSIKPEVLDYLIQRGFSKEITILCPDQTSTPSNLSPLIPIIAADDDVRLKKILRQEKIDINDTIWSTPQAEHTALSFAAKCGSNRCIELLLSQKDIDVNRAVKSDDIGWECTPLGLAALSSNAECAKAFINTPKLDLSNSDNLAGLLASNHQELISLYIRKLNAKTKSPSTPISPLCFSVGCRTLSGFLQLTHAKGFNLPNGNTLLYGASALGNAVAVQILLNKGADPNAKNAAGLTAIGMLNKYYMSNKRSNPTLEKCIRLITAAGGAE